MRARNSLKQRTAHELRFSHDPRDSEIIISDRPAFPPDMGLAKTHVVTIRQVQQSQEYRSSVTEPARPEPTRTADPRS